MEQKQKYITIAVSIVGFVVIALGVYVLFGQAPQSDEEVLESAQTSQDTTASNSGQPSSNSGTNSNTTSTTAFSEVETGVISVGETNESFIRFANQSTGEIFVSELFTESFGSGALDLPGGAVDYVFITDDSSFDKYVVYKQGGNYFAWDRDNEQTIRLDADIDYAVIDDLSDKVYYIANQSGLNSEIRVMDWNGENTQTLVDRPGIQWMQLSRGSVYYRTATQLYRYSTADQRETLIESASLDIAADFSERLSAGVVEIDGESYLYQLQAEEDILLPLPFDVDPKTVIWRDTERAFYNVKDDILYKYDWGTQEIIEWTIEGGLDESSINYDDSFVMNDGTIVVISNGTLLVSPGFSRAGL